MEGLLHNNLVRAAATLPDKVAFRCGSTEITFAELDIASRRVAAALAAEGVQSGDRIALKTQLSIAAMIGVYGVLRAGAVFVPIDPNLPASRVAELLNSYRIRCLIALDSAVPEIELVIDQAPDLGHVFTTNPISPATSCRVISWANALATEPSPAISLTRDAPAYIISTSGSTGEPKGIVHTHASGQSYAALTVHQYSLCSADRIASLSPLHFDMFTFGVFAGVLAMATVVLVPPAWSRLPASLSSLIAVEKLTVWYSVPFALIQLLERGALEKRDCSTLRWVIFAGEKFPMQHLIRLREQWQHAAFSNAYGPAETNVCTVFNLRPLAVQQPSIYASDVPNSLPIGKPWGAVKVLVLNDQCEPVADGTPGELAVSGPTVMANYVGGAAQDRRVFHIRHRGSQTDRFYRTGDLVRRLPDGNLEFLGRKDRQVKVRGHRIELDAVEAEIVAHPEIQECAVVLRSSDGVNELCATVTASNGAELDSAAIFEWLRQRVSGYTTPRSILVLESLPRTSSGKIDRLQIAALFQDQSAGAAISARPKSVHEETSIQAPSYVQ